MHYISFNIIQYNIYKFRKRRNLNLYSRPLYGWERYFIQKMEYMPGYK